MPFVLVINIYKLTIVGILNFMTRTDFKIMRNKDEHVL